MYPWRSSLESRAACEYLCTYDHVRVYVCVCVHLCACVCLYVCASVCVYVCAMHKAFYLGFVCVCEGQREFARERERECERESD